MESATRLVLPEPNQTQPAADHILSEPNTSLASKTLTKSALKKLAKAERFAAQKLERRAREKEAKKEKKRIKAEKRAAGELDEDDEEKRRQKKKPRIARNFGGRVVIDLGFDDMMSEKEIKSLCSQLAYTYSANRQASYPFSLVYTSLTGRTFTRLEGMSDAGYKRWANTEWWHEGYERLWLSQQGNGRETQEAEGNPEDPAKDTNETDTRDENRGTAQEPPKDIQQHVVYLTADSEEELAELKEDETYIIGGICDHNRYKNLCLNKANETGIRTARLPIGRYLASLPTRKVLTVNQVFEILLRWAETRDWEEALYAVIPKRKFQGGGKGKIESGKDGDMAVDDVKGESVEAGSAGMSAEVDEREEARQPNPSAGDADNNPTSN